MAKKSPPPPTPKDNIFTTKAFCLVESVLGFCSSYFAKHNCRTFLSLSFIFDDFTVIYTTIKK
jgi:hypothetical protein